VILLGSSLKCAPGRHQHAPGRQTPPVVPATTNPRQRLLGAATAQRELARAVPGWGRGVRAGPCGGPCAMRMAAKAMRAKRMPRCGWRKTGRFVFSTLAQRRRAQFARRSASPRFQIVGGSINCDQFRSSFNCASRCPRAARGRFDCQVASCSLRWLLIRVATVLKTQGTDARLPRKHRLEIGSDGHHLCILGSLWWMSSGARSQVNGSILGSSATLAWPVRMPVDGPAGRIAASARLR
jgi:hypothetical protein